MKNLLFATISLLFISLVFSSCGDDITVVESGTYNGIVEEVEDDKQEIYVRLSENRMIELYFTPETSLTKNGKKIPFEILDEGQAVEVSVEKIGQRNDPLTVKILN